MNEEPPEEHENPSKRTVCNALDSTQQYTLSLHLCEIRAFGRRSFYLYMG